jgi:hypothetical protein
MELFSMCQTQWRTHAAGLIGLDYTAVEAVSRAMAMEWDMQLFGGIRALELYELGVIGKSQVGGKPKPCRGPACAMCTKRCADRLKVEG